MKFLVFTILIFFSSLNLIYSIDSTVQEKLDILTNLDEVKWIETIPPPAEEKLISYFEFFLLFFYSKKIPEFSSHSCS